jgi:L-aspartate oxidase
LAAAWLGKRPHYGWQPSRKVTLISKRTLEDSASSWAQGGIAAVLDNRDSIEAHIRDTINAGALLNDPRATRFVIENGRRAVDWLIEQGVPFTRDQDGYHLTREGGHSHRRVIHVADATGSAVQDTLTQKVARPSEHHRVRASHRHRPHHRRQIRPARQRLPRSLRTRQTGRPCGDLSAPHTVLATGGTGKVYLYTTNPIRRPATASPWPGVPAVVWRTWNSSSFIRPASTTRKPSPF